MLTCGDPFGIWYGEKAISSFYQIATNIFLRTIFLITTKYTCYYSNLREELTNNIHVVHHISALLMRTHFCCRNC